MCGICGLYSKNAVDGRQRKLVEDMNECIKHRGPNDSGVFSGKHAVLGHRRLSILDLSVAGRQPMEYMDKYVICFNGEIYNYIELREELVGKGYLFNTRTDTEVIMAAFDCWGKDCQNKFNGMWAFAIYNKEDSSLFISRDRYGVKPIYYMINNDDFIFASEIKALLCDDSFERIANDTVILDYLVNGFVDCSEETFFRGVYRVPAATSIIIDKDMKLVKESYYKINYKEDADKLSDKEDINKFKQIFEDSIKLRLRSDVPLGNCLSGGLDSSSIVCHCNSLLRKSNDVFTHKTFSACYKEKEVNEKKYIDDVVSMTGAESFCCYPTAEGLMNDLNHLIYTQDEPFVSTSMYASYCVMRLARENNVTVLLDGQGADELLCGYRKARVYYIKKLLDKKHFIRALRELITYIPHIFKSTSTLKADIGMLMQFLGKEKKKTVRREYLNSDFSQKDLSHSYKNNNEFLLNDFRSIVLPALLRYVDRNSMAFSIEDRLPFLDYRLVDFCMQLPLDSKIHRGISKYIMRQALNMPKSVRKRKDKIGFATPEKMWMSKMQDSYKQVFDNNDFKAGRFINNKKIIENWDRIITEKDNIAIFRYVCLEKWMNIFSVK